MLKTPVIVLCTLSALILVAGHAEAQQRAVGPPIQVDFAAPGDTRVLLLAPFDAPYTSTNYISRIDDILGSISLSGTPSHLAETPIETYRQIIYDAKIIEPPFTRDADRLVKLSARWLIDGKSRPTAGYNQFRELYQTVVSAESSGSYDVFVKALVKLFSQGDAFEYISSEQIFRAYSKEPKFRVYRSIRERYLGEGQRLGYLYYPRPDDLDIAEIWRPIVLQSDGSNEVIQGLATYVDVSVLGTDRILESLVERPSTEARYYLPRRLTFVKELATIPRPAAQIDGSSYIDFPTDGFSIYTDSFRKPSAAMFLLAVEMEEVLP